MGQQMSMNIIRKTIHETAKFIFIFPFFFSHYSQAQENAFLNSNSKNKTSFAPPEGTRDKKGGFVSDKTKAKFSEANIEDINNKNFPDLIESFDYPNAEITDVVKAISELTGKNFIIDPAVRGKITIIAPSQITVAEAYKAFLSALAINGMAVVPTGDGFLKIKPAREAQRDSIETYSGSYYPNSDTMITKIIKLKYISAEEVNKNLRQLQSKVGEINPYPPTNSIIMTDYGSNVDRFMKIITQLDIPGYEEQLEVMRIKYAKAKDMADLIDQIITKGEGRGGGNQGFGGVPRFRRASPDGGGGNATGDIPSLVLPDDRTNSIIVVGNQAAVDKTRKLVARLDFRLRPEDEGGVFVYYVRYSEAEKIAEMINGIATESKKAMDQGPGTARPGVTGAAPGPSANVIFGGDVKVTADKITNSLIVVSSKPDYEKVKNLLSKIDIARDQVFVKTIIMELAAQDKAKWGIDYYRFDKASAGIGRMGFRSSDSVSSILSPESDSGGTFGFGFGGTFDLKTSTGTIPVASLTGLINFFKSNVSTNILSEPTVMALDNEEALIEVGDKVPVSLTTSMAAGGISQQSANREPVTIKLTLTPYISPDTDSVQMKINQEINQISTTNVGGASEVAKNGVTTSTRNVKTQIVVNSGDTAVLGGLMQDKDEETIKKIPILGDIPILGWLFKSKLTEKNKKNLMIFITPKVVRNGDDSGAILNQKLNERIEFIQRSMNGRDPFGEILDNLPRRAAKETSPNPDMEEMENNEEPAGESL
ncbi:MAG: type II secretion system secretin GspD [Bdellovibrionales bacterium]|nr:type II secretion system secretin GspD [Bdellovibrionales bacterium]